MNGQNTLWYPYNEIVLIRKNEWSTNRCYKVDISWKHTKWKKSDTEGHMLYASTYVKWPEGQIHRERI